MKDATDDFSSLSIFGGSTFTSGREIFLGLGSNKHRHT
jgi:hypothetical protein